jgi:multicomponent Na+:H+ antiporter subunit F
MVAWLVGCALLAAALGIVRVVRGPTQADRVVALDVLFAAALLLCVAAALAARSPAFLDVGIGTALIGFVATASWARLIRRAPREEPR